MSEIGAKPDPTGDTIIAHWNQRLIEARELGRKEGWDTCWTTISKHLNALLESPKEWVNLDVENKYLVFVPPVVGKVMSQSLPQSQQNLIDMFHQAAPDLAKRFFARFDSPQAPTNPTVGENKP